MSFPVVDDEGKRIMIEDKIPGAEAEVLLVSEEGDVFVANAGFDALKVELLEARDAAKNLGGEVAEALDEVGDAGESFLDEAGDVINAAGDLFGGDDDPEGGEGEMYTPDPNVVDESEVDATEAAIARAEEAGVDLTTVEGSGKDGRIIATDIPTDG